VVPKESNNKTEQKNKVSKAAYNQELREPMQSRLTLEQAEQMIAEK
jgi:hypothetical protein